MPFKKFLRNFKIYLACQVNQVTTKFPLSSNEKVYKTLPHLKKKIRNAKTTLRRRKQNLLFLKASSNSLNRMKGEYTMIYTFICYLQEVQNGPPKLRVPPNCSLFNFVEENRRVCGFPPSLVTCT